MTDPTSQPSSRELPVWASAVVVVVCLLGAGGYAWWYVTSDGPTVVAMPTDAPAEDPERAARLAARRAFFQAARDGDLPAVTAALDRDPRYATRRDREGNDATALHYACWEGRLPVVELLVARGAELEAVDGEYDGTPLNWAIVAGRKDVVDVLLARGAKLRPGMLAGAENGAKGGFKSMSPNPPEAYGPIVDLLKARGAQ